VTRRRSIIPPGAARTLLLLLLLCREHTHRTSVDFVIIHKITRFFFPPRFFSDTIMSEMTGYDAPCRSSPSRLARRARVEIV